MDSSLNPNDIISRLPDVVLVVILSFLSFKDNVKTTKKVSFVLYMLQWISRVNIQVIESFEICLYNPVGFKAEIKSLVEFAISRRVKKLVLDFLSPFWKTIFNVWKYDDIVFELPELVYIAPTLEVLKLYACKIDASRLANPRLRKLSLGWLRLQTIESILSKCPLLESLSLSYCYDLDEMIHTGQIREVIFESIATPYMHCSLNLPNVEFFKYSGNVMNIHIEKVNRMLKEVSLNFGVENEYEDPFDPNEAGEVLSHLLNDLRSSKKLTVSPYLLEVIPECDNPVDMLRDVETQHLVLETYLHANEFMGIKLLIDHCPNLETLTVNILSPKPYHMASHGAINSETLWPPSISFRCLRRTLKVLVVRPFCGSWIERHLLAYFVWPEHGDVLERVELYLPTWLNETQRMWARFGADSLQSTSNRVNVILYNA
ncbi:hypothetical protein CARUB_v10019051mg [Capsella rubella]|uniref:FBD domain-containing protein n=1 Tax=Capsella rubella TaxID=81985 RepID=R0HP13_9BRAS|nr:hypothetical protein CARUB_v10019051mg [Capsella rubella]